MCSLLWALDPLNPIKIYVICRFARCLRGDSSSSVAAGKPNKSSCVLLLHVAMSMLQCYYPHRFCELTLPASSTMHGSVGKIGLPMIHHDQEARDSQPASPLDYALGLKFEQEILRSRKFPATVSRAACRFRRQNNFCALDWRLRARTELQR